MYAPRRGVNADEHQLQPPYKFVDNFVSSKIGFLAHHSPDLTMFKSPAQRWIVEMPRESIGWGKWRLVARQVTPFGYSYRCLTAWLVLFCCAFICCLCWAGVRTCVEAVTLHRAATQERCLKPSKCYFIIVIRIFGGAG